jgi:hypothetical protein
MEDIDEINAKIKENMVNKIIDVLNRKVENVSIPYVRPNDVITYLEKLNDGESIDTDFDSNGWSWDFWIRFEYKDQNYILAGDGYYDKAVTLSIDKEEY